MTEPSAGLVIRRAEPGDEAGILVLAPRLVAFGPPPWRDAEAMTVVDLDELRKAIGSDAPGHAVFVAVSGNEIAGFAHVHPLGDHYRRRDHAHLSDLVVAQGHEGRGVASKLIGHVEAWACDNGYDWLGLAVFDRNVRAARLYERLGFRRDVVRMIKPLDRAAQRDAPLPAASSDRD